jgi:hypothetical protein
MKEHLRARMKEAANQTYIEEGVQLLQLAHRAHALFKRQEPSEKRRLQVDLGTPPTI